MDFVLPPVGEGLLEVDLVKWLVAPGETVQRGQSLMEVMSDKATMEVTSTFSGTIQETSVEEGAKIKVGELILKFNKGDGQASPVVEETPSTENPAFPLPRGELAGVMSGSNSTNPTKKSTVVPSQVPQASLPPAAPSVRHLARKLGLDLANIRGTGPAGRILLEDLTTHLKPNRAEETPKQATERTGLDLGKAGTRYKITGLRKKIAEHMVESKRHIPHYAYIDECDVTDLVRLRSQLKSTFGKVGVKLTFLPFIIKAVARALKEVPIVNSTYNESQNEVTTHDQYNIGIAVAIPNGLIVPVIKNADQKDVAVIATEIERISQDARAGKSKLEDLKGGTFTVTSVGNLGGLISTPIINSPEVGILGIGKVVKRPVYDDHDQLRPAEMLYLSFSFDHRILDGAIGATFGNAILKHLRNPASLLLPERFAS